MLRTALRPWSLGLLALALAAASAFAALGDWQLGRSRSQAPPPTTEQVRPLTQVLTPTTSFPGSAIGQRVRVSGEYVAAQQLLVENRPQEGRDGSWVLTPLRVATGSGPALLPVVRGWVPAGQDGAVPLPPSGTVEVTGRLQHGEPPVGVDPAGAAGRVRAVSPADLVNVWGPPLYTGFVVADAAPQPLEAVPVQAPAAERNLRNVSYAVQWWLFAAFAVFLWWRVVRDRHQRALEDAQDAEGAGGPSDAGGAGGPADAGGGAVGQGWEDGPVRAQQVEEGSAGARDTQEASR